MKELGFDAIYLTSSPP